ncbi:MAG: hypothetical protein ABII89_00190 [Candidatus Omnitrophota bacterium]
MKIMARVLGVLGLLVLVVAIIACLMARQYKRAYLNEKSARATDIAETAGLFLTFAQENLLKASLAVNRGNFEEAKDEIASAKKSLGVFASRPLPEEMKGTGDFSASVAEIETDLVKVNPDVQKKILVLAGTITDLLNSANKK